MKSLDLEAAIGSQISQATGSHHSEINKARADLFNRYMGEPYGNERRNRSTVVATEVSDVIEWVLPELMEVFTSGDKVASFEPQGPEDEEAADQETDSVNYVFYRQNDGFMAMYNFLKDGLVQRNGYIKRWWESKERAWTESYEDLTPEEFMAQHAKYDEMAAAGEVEIKSVDVEETEDGISAEIQLYTEEKKLKVMALPPEEVLIKSQWNQVSLDDCPFVAHRRTVTVSDLVEMGYDRKQVESLPSSHGDDDMSEEHVDRFTTKGAVETSDEQEADASMREVLVHECYMLVDYNDDGVAERRKVTVAGTSNNILKWADGTEDNEEVYGVPISAWTPIPIPHKHVGRSYAELVTDLQRVNTTLLRQMLDNIYAANNATREIARDGIDGENTIKDLLVDMPGKVIRTKAPGHYIEHRPPDVVSQSLAAMEFTATVRENRTGVNRHNQGMDADSLNKTATGARLQMTQGMKKLMLVARVAAETGIRHLFRGIHSDLRNGAGKALKLRLRGQYVDVDPRQWRDRSDMTVSVGIGTGNREERMGYLTAIIAEQKEHLLAGSNLATPAQLFNSYERFIEGAGFKNAEEFFVNPLTAQPEAPEQPEADPMDAVAQIEFGKAQIKEQGATQRKAMDLEAKQREQMLDAQQGQARLAYDYQNMSLTDDRERDKAIVDAAVRLSEKQGDADSAFELEALKALMAPPAGLN